MTNNCGVYAITNTVNGNRYIGSSVNISQRWSQHTRHLNKNEHHSGYLQRAWNLHGADSFTFETILLCDIENNLYYEQILLDGLKPAYNIALSAAAPMQGLQHTEEARAQISLAMKGRVASPEARAINSAAHKGLVASAESIAINSAARTGALNPNFGKHPSEETRRKLSEAHKGKPHTEEHKLKLGLAAKRDWAARRIATGGTL